MKRLRVGVLDLVGNKPAPGMWNRLMKPNFAAIMPQVVAVWCEELGHDVTFVCHTGTEELEGALPTDLDILFITVSHARSTGTPCSPPPSATDIGQPARSPPSEAPTHAATRRMLPATMTMSSASPTRRCSRRSCATVPLTARRA